MAALCFTRWELKAYGKSARAGQGGKPAGRGLALRDSLGDDENSTTDLRDTLMKHFLLIYDYVPDYMERRTPYRPTHFALAQAAAARGDLFLAGACTDEGLPLGVLVFKAADRRLVEDFAHADPYVLNGVVTAWQVREWTTVIGKDALTAVPPAAPR
jgi:uncharacterized protein YciI